jgi:hypothetical protein
MNGNVHKEKVESSYSHLEENETQRADGWPERDEAGATGATGATGAAATDCNLPISQVHLLLSSSPTSLRFSSRRLLLLIFDYLLLAAH